MPWKPFFRIKRSVILQPHDLSDACMAEACEGKCEMVCVLVFPGPCSRYPRQHKNLQKADFFFFFISSQYFPRDHGILKITKLQH